MIDTSTWKFVARDPDLGEEGYWDPFVGFRGRLNEAKLFDTPHDALSATDGDGELLAVMVEWEPAVLPLSDPGGIRYVVQWENSVDFWRGSGKGWGPLSDAMVFEAIEDVIRAMVMLGAPGAVAREYRAAAPVRKVVASLGGGV